ncbi:phosphodiester glycosidase family protein [Luteolibacter sp. Populi]|uniref:phosphodiester glycosidase family protein n=1 Tax=Luteolibacter sp. Populi TaxID=3230487 RepID=UPI00346712B7
MRFILSQAALAAAITLLAAAGEPPSFAPLSPEKDKPAWQPLYQGIDYRLDELSKPRVLRIHTARIDTRAKGLTFFATPDNGDAPGEVNGRRTATFLKEFDLELAINGTGFAPITAPGKPVDVLGLSVSDGKLVSEADLESGNPVFLITVHNEARILRTPFKKEDLAPAHTAMQGWYGANGMLLDDGETITSTRDIHPRTAAGVSQDGRYVYLLVVDGRQPGLSEGMNLIELASWMKGLGCWDAINLDGGGSTTMVMKDPAGKPRILNSIPGGVQRSVANHLGVHADPLPAEP